MCVCACGLVDLHLPLFVLEGGGVVVLGGEKKKNYVKKKKKKASEKKIAVLVGNQPLRKKNLSTNLQHRKPAVGISFTACYPSLQP